jgi:hypothetical protein
MMATSLPLINSKQGQCNIIAVGGRWDDGDGGNGRKKKRGKKKGRRHDDNRFKRRFDPVLAKSQV